MVHIIIINISPLFKLKLSVGSIGKKIFFSKNVNKDIVCGVSVCVCVGMIIILYMSLYLFIYSNFTHKIFQPQYSFPKFLR